MRVVGLGRLGVTACDGFRVGHGNLTPNRQLSTQPYPLIDLRVDEHDEPIGELRRVFELYKPTIEYYEIRPWQPHALGGEADWIAAQAAKRTSR